MQEVDISPLPMSRLADVIGPDRWQSLSGAAREAVGLLDGRVVWHLNSTAQGGGVAEMLQTLLAYCRSSGIDTRWLVVQGEPQFFATTKRLHNTLHGEPGDGGELGDAERANYEQVLAANLAEITKLVRPGDIVLAHDPQTAGLIPGLREHGARVVWRSHIGRDEPNEHTERGWAFLEPYLGGAEEVVVSRPAYRPPSVPERITTVIAPSIDPFATKNDRITEETARAVLIRAGILQGADDGQELRFHRRDGSAGVLRQHRDMFAAGGPVPVDAPLVVQVSRWDRLKDMPGVMTGFVEHLDGSDDAHLILAGPSVAEVSDDPEGAEVLEECRSQWAALPPEAQRRVHLACVPMDDVDENAHVINALQTHAAVVVQKSLREGFGLTVTEAMWKARPVVASAVGGIQDQIVHDRDGILLPDPSDLSALGAALGDLLQHPDRARTLGSAAHERVRSDFLGDRHLLQYGALIARLG